MSDLSRYYDYDRLTINGNKYRIDFSANTAIPEAEIERITVDHHSVEAAHGVLWELREFRDLDRNQVVLPYQNAIIHTAQKIAQRLQPYACIHVRRGDRITDSKIGSDTSCANIFDKIKRCGLTTVYIMSDEEPCFFWSLKSTPFNVLLYCDFHDLSGIRDNYLLFCIENEIMRRAAKRVSTFKTLDFPEKGYYDFHLSEEIGWQ